MDLRAVLNDAPPARSSSALRKPNPALEESVSPKTKHSELPALRTDHGEVETRRGSSATTMGEAGGWSAPDGGAASATPTTTTQGQGKEQQQQQGPEKERKKMKKRQRVDESEAGRKKRVKYGEPPVWAQKARTEEREGGGKAPGSGSGRTPAAAPPSHAAPPNHAAPNHAPPPPQLQQRAPPQHAPQHTRSIPGYGPWEPTITTIEPHEELTRTIADFLYTHIITSPIPPSSPCTLEIEAKVGLIIDKTTNTRLRLPIRTETIFDADDPSWRIAFRSSMSEPQHRKIHAFLNSCFMDTKNTPGRREMTYLRTREKDSFYELPGEGYRNLPEGVREVLNPRHKLRVRVTRDKDGEVLAKIVKARVADLNVYSPRTAFDWRVSVSVEVPYEGAVEGLYPLGGGTEGEDRAKDRVSYRSLVYQVDLTQVTDSANVKDHELEVEVDGKEIRKQGMLAQRHEPNGYEAMVKGFVDNVRVLVREVGGH